MHRPSYPFAHERPTSPTDASSSIIPSSEHVHLSNFGRQLDAIVANPNFLASSTQWLNEQRCDSAGYYALEVVAQSVSREFEGGDDLWGMEKAVHITSEEHGMQIEESQIFGVEQAQDFNMEQISDTQLHSWNPYGDVFPAASGRKRKSDELGCDDAAKKYRYQAYPAGPPASPRIPEPPSTSACAEVLPQAYGVVPPPVAAALQYHSPAPSAYPSPEIHRYNSSVPSSYAPPASSPSAPPVSSQKPYPGCAQDESPYSAREEPPNPSFSPSASPNSVRGKSPYPGYSPKSLQPANKPVLQYDTPAALQPASNAPIPSAPSAPARTRKPPMVITRNISTKPTAKIYETALNMKQQLYDWWTEHDRLGDVMEQKKKRHAARMKEIGCSDMEVLRCPEERESRSKLMSRIRHFQKQFEKLNKELERRNVVLPL